MTSIHVIEQGEYNNNNSQKDNTTTNSALLSLPYTRLRLIPITGRTHQLRVHLAALGYPICCDPTYSLYGEAAPVGGLQYLSSHCFIVMTIMISMMIIRIITTKLTFNKKSGQSTLNVGGCRLGYQKNWTNEYPPNVKPMCLHAAKLVLEHPITGKPFCLGVVTIILRTAWLRY